MQSIIFIIAIRQTWSVNGKKPVRSVLQPLTNICFPLQSEVDPLARVWVEPLCEADAALSAGNTIRHLMDQFLGRSGSRSLTQRETDRERERE